MTIEQQNHITMQAVALLRVLKEYDDKVGGLPNVLQIRCEELDTALTDAGVLVWARRKENTR